MELIPFLLLLSSQSPPPSLPPSLPHLAYPTLESPRANRKSPSDLTASAQRPPGSQGGPPLPQGGPTGYAGIPAGLTGQPPSQSVASPPVGYSLPQPSASGSLDLSNIKPTTSGKVSLDDALARAKARAAEMGIQPTTYREQAREFFFLFSSSICPCAPLPLAPPHKEQRELLTPLYI